MASPRAKSAMTEAFARLGEVGKREHSELNRLVKTIEVIEQYAGGFQGKRVLELGASLGAFLLAAKQLGATRALGFDKFTFPGTHPNPFRLSSEEMAFVSRRWSETGVEMLEQDISEPFPLGNESCDLVISNAMVEHCHGIHKALFQEINRVLVPGGYVVFTTPNLAVFLKRIRFLIGRSPLWDFRDYFQSGTQFTGHVREFTVQECRQILEWSNFEPVRVISRPTYFRWSWFKMPKKWHNLIFQGLSCLRPTWGDLIFAVGRKR